MKKKNPVIEQAEQRGFAMGMEAGQTRVINFMEHWFNCLEDISGVGPKTAERIRNEFAKKYGVTKGEY